MKILFLISILIISTHIFYAQNDDKDDGIYVVEEFNASNASSFEGVQIIYLGHREFSTYFRKLSKKLKNIGHLNIQHTISLEKEEIFTVNSFDDLNVNSDLISKEMPAICLLHIGENIVVERTRNKSLTDINQRPVNYYLYLKLLDTNTNEVVLKRKFLVKTRYTMLENVKELAKEISQVLLLKKIK
ncbi:hypothetical protein [Gangjinia marincola]